MDKRDLGLVFRERLQLLIRRSSVTRSAFAHSVGIDRSALTQLLSDGSTRLPRADTLRRIAETYGASVDWLLGISEDETPAAEIKPALEIAVAEGADNDTLLERWHKEAVGYKIRYVPAQIPDLLRTPAVIDYEYSGRTAPSPSWQLRNAEFRLDYSAAGRRPTWKSACHASGWSCWPKAADNGGRSTPRRARRSSPTSPTCSKSSTRLFGFFSTTSFAASRCPTRCSARCAPRSMSARCTWC